MDAKNFSTIWTAYQSTRRLDTGRICVWGMLSPKLYTKCGRPLGGWWCIPSGILQSTRLQYSRRRLRWTNETDAADQNELIIIDFTFTRTFSNHNIVITTHEKIYYKFAHSVTENTIYMISSRNQGSVPWIKRLGTIHFDFLCDLPKGRSRSKKHNNHRT